MIHFPAPSTLCSVTSFIGAGFTALFQVVMEGKIDMGSPSIKPSSVASLILVVLSLYLFKVYPYINLNLKQVCFSSFCQNWWRIPQKYFSFVRKKIFDLSYVGKCDRLNMYSIQHMGSEEKGASYGVNV